MLMSLALGKIIGVYLLIVGTSLLARRKSWMQSVKDLQKNESTVRLVAAFELLVGLIVTTYHNYWMLSWEVIITLFGWLMIIEGALYLFLSHKQVSSLVKAFNKPRWYFICGITSIFLGAYLISVSFSVQ